MLKYTLLGFLNYWPMSGYDLKQVMDRSTTHFWHARLSQIYTTLKALEEAGCVTSAIEERQERPDRRLYTITEQGRRELRDWLAQPYAELSSKKESLVLKVFFSAQMDRQTILAQLRLQRDLHSRQVTQYREAAQALQQAAAEHPELARDALLWEATRRFGEMYEQLYARWLEETIQLVEEQFDS